MINLSDVTKALQKQLNNDKDVRAFLRNKVVRGEMVNMDPNRAPWVGVYRGNVSYAPRTLGSMSNWEASPEIRVIVQASDMRSAEDCETALERYVELVLTAINSDITLDGTVDMINSYDVEVGYMETDRASTYFQGASITLKTEVATS